MKHSLRIAHKHAWKRWGVLPLLLSIALTFVIVASVSAAVVISATKTDAFVGIHDGDDKADPGETIEYTVVVTNSGSTDATGVTFNDVIDTNTTLVPGSLVVSPLALDETYSSVGNMTLTSSAINPTCGGNPLRSVTCNDLINGSTLVGFGATQPTANGTVVNGSNTVTTSNSGTVLLNTDGTFVYNPAAGFEGADGFWYTLSNSVGNDNAHVTINVGGANGMVWFISSAGGGGGRQANPFTLAAFNTANTGVGTNPADGDTVFLFEGAHTGPVTLRNNQKFIGQDATVSVQTLGGPTAQPGNTYPTINPTGATVAITSAGIGVTLGSGNIVAGLTVGNATTAMNGGAVGTLKVREVTINTNGSGLIISTSGTITTDATFTGFTGITTTGGTNGISLTGVGGTLNTGGSLSGASGATFDVSGGTVSSTYSGSITQGNNAPMVSIAGGHSGTITFQTGTLNATNGTGLQFSNADGIYNFNGSTTLNGGDAGVDITTGSAGTFTFASGTAITNPSGIAYREDTSTANVIYNGTITKTNNANNAVDINAKTGGTTSFAGAITASTTTANAIDLTNTGGTVNFSGGLNITTTSGVGFNATGTGATINVCDENPCNPAATGALANTITTTTGTALNVANTTIGSNKLEFRSISSNGATNGIVLNNTGSGGLSVKGNTSGNCGGSVTVNTVGTPATVGAPVTGDCSGGIIQASTGHGIVLNNAPNVSLTRMYILNSGLDGINALTVNGFTLANSYITDSSGAAGDRGIEMGDFSTGTAVNGAINVTNSKVGPTPHDNFGVGIGSGTSTWNITGTVFDDSQLNSGFNFEIRNATVSNFLIDGSVFQNQFADGMQMQPASGVNATITLAVIQNSSFTGNNIGMDLNHDGTSNVTYRVLTNTFLNQVAQAVNFFSSAVQAPTTGGTLTGRFVGNVIGDAAVFNSGGGMGIRININGGADSTVLVDSNTIRQVPNGRGIEIMSRNGTGGLDATVTNNFVNTDFVPTVPNGGFSLSNIFLQSNCVTVCNTLRADVRGNTVPATSPNGDLTAFQLALIETGASTFQLVDTTAPISGTCTSELTGTNTGNAGANAGCSLIAGPIILAYSPNNSQSLAQYPAEDNRQAASFASNTDTNPAAAFAPAYDVGSMYRPAVWVMPNEQAVSPAAALIASDAADRKSGLFAPPTVPTLSGETVSIPAFTLPAGKTVTIKFRVTVNGPQLPLGTTRILNQSTISGSNFSNVTTTDPAPSADPACAGAGTQTCTPVDRPDTTIVSINRSVPSGSSTNAASVTWLVTFADPITGLTASNFTLANSGLTGPSITSVSAVTASPDTQWTVTANTGTGNGTLGLDMINDTGCHTISPPFCLSLAKSILSTRPPRQ